MWRKFSAGAFGSPSLRMGIPMDATISRIGKVVMPTPFIQGRQAESYANRRPKPPVYRNIPRVPGGGNLGQYSDPYSGGYDSSGINPGGGALPVPPFFNAFV